MGGKDLEFIIMSMLTQQVRQVREPYFVYKCSGKLSPFYS